MKNLIAETERRRLPSFDCPNLNCKARNIAFAMSREAKNESELIPIEFLSDAASADFAVVCPKCKSKYVLYRHRETPIIPFKVLPLYASVAT